MSIVRRCNNCTGVINVLVDCEDATRWYCAWLAGFCSPICQRASARAKVDAKQAWWQHANEPEPT